MKYFFTSLIFVLLTPSWSVGASKIEVAKKKVATLKEEITTLRASLAGLDSLQQRLIAELVNYEKTFESRLKRVLVPLLNWPSVSSLTQVRSWVEMEHAEIVLESTRSRLVREPLLLISDRELRIREAESMRKEFSESLRNLERKEALLDLQIEELKMIQKRNRKK